MKQRMLLITVCALFGLGIGCHKHVTSVAIVSPIGTVDNYVEKGDVLKWVSLPGGSGFTVRFDSGNPCGEAVIERKPPELTATPGSGNNPEYQASCRAANGGFYLYSIILPSGGGIPPGGGSTGKTQQHIYHIGSCGQCPQNKNTNFNIAAQSDHKDASILESCPTPDPKPNGTLVRLDCSGNTVEASQPCPAQIASPAQSYVSWSPYPVGSWTVTFPAGGSPCTTPGPFNTGSYCTYAPQTEGKSYPYTVTCGSNKTGNGTLTVPQQF